MQHHTEPGAGRERENAIKYYQAAALKTNSLPERNYLLTKAARLSNELRLMGEPE